MIKKKTDPYKLIDLKVFEPNHAFSTISISFYCTKAKLLFPQYHYFQTNNNFAFSLLTFRKGQIHFPRKRIA